jgi:hypothetical protein
VNVTVEMPNQARKVVFERDPEGRVDTATVEAA